MIRIKPIERKRIMHLQFARIWNDWTCRHGAWNRDKLLDELEKKLKKERRER
jgi:hypothetical protein